jgi:hypothetical protein
MTDHPLPTGEAMPPQRGLFHLVLLREGGRWWPVIGHHVDHTGSYRLGPGGEPAIAR